MSPFAAVTAVISVVASAMALHSVSSSLLFALIAARRLRSPSSRRMIVRFTAATASATIAAEPSIKNAETETAALVQQSFLYKENHAIVAWFQKALAMPKMNKNS